MQSNDSSWILKNLDETIAFGKSLPEKMDNAKLLLLEGPLGAGKTSLVKGLAIALGIKEPVTSPTFALAQHYPNERIPLIHLDLYRLENANDANGLFLEEEEFAKTINAVIVIEWPERLSLELPEAWKIKLNYFENDWRLLQLESPFLDSSKAITSE